MELKKILHVEDDADIREIAKVAMEMMGNFEVLQCATGQEAIDSAAAFGPQLLLLDVMMPGMNGPETAAVLRKLPETENCPVIYMTAKAQEQEIADLMGLGAIGTITKPFNPTGLPDEIRALWAQALADG